MFNTIGPTTRLETAKRFLSFLLSLALHGIVLAALIAIPLIFFNVLPEFDLLSFVFAAPTLPPPTPRPDEFHSVAVRPVTIAHTTEFTEPIKIPDGVIPAPADEPPIALPGLPVSVNGRGMPQGAPGFSAEALGLLNAVPPPVPDPPRPNFDKKPTLPLGGVVLQSKLVKKVVPEYPPLAKQTRVSGSVVLQVNVDEDGNVVDIKVLSGHPLLEEAAVNAVRQWKYSPTLLNGEPVPVVATVTVVFSLK